MLPRHARKLRAIRRHIRDARCPLCRRPMHRMPFPASPAHTDWSVRCAPCEVQWGYQSPAYFLRHSDCTLSADVRTRGYPRAKREAHALFHRILLSAAKAYHVRHLR